MLEWYWLFLPIVSAVTNRIWRGEGSMPRFEWYALNILTAFLLTCVHDGIYITTVYVGIFLGWVLYFLGYAIFPWQAMFSAINGQTPSRKDNWSVQWMQSISFSITAMITPMRLDNPKSDWYAFGCVYGFFRALLMMPGILILSYMTHSYIPLVGAAALLMGVVYYLGGVFSRRETQGNGLGVAFSELAMGWWNGTYMLIVALAIQNPGWYHPHPVGLNPSSSQFLDSMLGRHRPS